MRIPWLVGMVVAFTACTSATGDTGADADSGTGTGGSTGDGTATPTGGEPAFTPTAGDYAFTSTNTTGSCGPGNAISGVVAYDTFTISVAGDGFTMQYDDDVFDDHQTFTCTLAGMDFTCTGLDVEVLYQSPPETRAALAMTAAGTWASATELSVTLTGALACTGDMAVCDEAASGWELTMPCDMIRVHMGALTG